MPDEGEGGDATGAKGREGQGDGSKSGEGDRGREGQNPRREGGDTDSTQTITELRAALKKANGEAAAHRKKAEELENAALSESEKRDKRIKELEAEQSTWQRERRDATIRQAVGTAARKAGALYPDDVYLLVRDELKVSDDGKPEGVDDAIKDLRKSRPALFGAGGSADGGAGRNGQPPSSMNDMIRNAAGRR